VVNSLAKSVLRRHRVRLGILLGAVFGLWNLIATMVNPLADDTPHALLVFYGPMFAIWAVAGFTAFRRSGQHLDAVKAASLVAFVTFVVFDIAVIVRVNLFLDAVSQRSDWRNVMTRFESSGFESLRLYVNYLNVTGAPFKILVASTIGAVMGLIGGLIGAASTRWLPKQALEAAGTRRLRNESFFSAPQLKRDPLDSASTPRTPDGHARNRYLRR